MPISQPTVVEMIPMNQIGEIVPQQQGSGDNVGIQVRQVATVEHVRKSQGASDMRLFLGVIVAHNMKCFLCALALMAHLFSQHGMLQSEERPSLVARLLAAIPDLAPSAVMFGLAMLGRVVRTPPSPIRRAILYLLWYTASSPAQGSIDFDSHDVCRWNHISAIPPSIVKDLQSIYQTTESDSAMPSSGPHGPSPQQNTW